WGPRKYRAESRVAVRGERPASPGGGEAPRCGAGMHRRPNAAGRSPRAARSRTWPRCTHLPHMRFPAPSSSSQSSTFPAASHRSDRVELKGYAADASALTVAADAPRATAPVNTGPAPRASTRPLYADVSRGPRIGTDTEGHE